MEAIEINLTLPEENVVQKEFISTWMNQWSEAIHNNNLDKGFWDDYNEEDVNHDVCKLGLITTEVSEAIEARREGLNDKHLPHRTGEEVELADAVIRIMDYCGKKGYDLGGAIYEKLEYNKTRPYKHGKAC